MNFIADLHIHSHYSLATSRELTPENLDFWARKKGITVVGTGDAVHPAWSAELQEKLKPEQGGLFSLRKDLRIPGFTDEKKVYFILTAEISSIYKKNGKVRKVHNVIILPDFPVLKKIQKRLEAIGNIRSDGRPILGLDSRDLLAIVLDESKGKGFLFPAHIWTPWFSALGSKSGFDSIEECFGDLHGHIHAVETGLSSDPRMNRQCSSLDRYTLVSNSDAHSPDKLGREANLFNTNLTYDSIITALSNPDSAGFTGTIEYFPEEGKYHFAGHRKCNVVLDPEQCSSLENICPACGKQLTQGVMSRVMEITDRTKPYNMKPFQSVTPLKNILSELYTCGGGSKKINSIYESLLAAIGPEFEILLTTPLSEIAGVNLKLAEGIGRLRSGDVTVESGYDGVFGSVSVFS